MGSACCAAVHPECGPVGTSDNGILDQSSNTSTVMTGRDSICCCISRHIPISQSLEERLLLRLSLLDISLSHVLIQQTPLIHVHRRAALSERVQNSTHIVHNSSQFIHCQRTRIRFRNNDISNTTLSVLGREPVHRVDVEPGRVYVVRLLSERQAINLAGHDERESGLGGNWERDVVEDWIRGHDGSCGITQLSAMDCHAADGLGIFVGAWHCA